MQYEPNNTLTDFESSLIIRDRNVKIDGRNFFDQLINNNINNI